jgi:hypothetical protein
MACAEEVKTCQVQAGAGSLKYGLAVVTAVPHAQL